MFNRFYLLVLCALNIQHGQRCRLYSRRDFGEPLPVIIKDGLLLEPTDRHGTVELDHGETLTLSCVDNGPLMHPNARSELSSASITCAGGTLFKNDVWLTSPGHFASFKCEEPPSHSSHRTNRTCFEGNPVIEVGYSVASVFYPVYETCFNELGLFPVYSKYTQKGYNAMYQTKVGRPFFEHNDVYGSVPVGSVFTQRGLKAALGDIIGRKADSYVSKQEFLSRGHLAAMTDFVFAFGERATFHYVNCAPQWTSFNGGNWNTLEVDLRNHIHSMGYDTIVYTGTFRTSQLDNHLGRRVDLYLAKDLNNNNVIPVPLYYYKVVYEPDTSRGIAFVGINSPYYTPTELKELAFCEDLCRGNSRFDWLTWQPDNPAKGYSFCCTIPDFRQIVNHLPTFEVHSVLY